MLVVIRLRQCPDTSYSVTAPHIIARQTNLPLCPCQFRSCYRIAINLP